MVRNSRHLTLIYLLALSLAVTLAGCAGEKTSPQVDDSGRIGTDDHLNLILGQVNIEGGLVERTFTFRNQGAEDLILKGAFTTCSCTKATFELSDGHSKGKFGTSMPSGWQQAISPGEEFKVHVEFDPLYHGPDDLGPFQRSVYLITSAPADDNLAARMPLIKNGTVTAIRIAGTVVSGAEYEASRPKPVFAASAGDFRFTETEFDFGTVKQSGGVVKHDFPFIYEGPGPVRIEGTPTSCGCTRANLETRELAPGDRGILTVEFDPNFHEEPEGRFFKTISILTDPPGRERAEVRIWARIDLDLGPEGYKYRGHKD